MEIIYLDDYIGGEGGIRIPGPGLPVDGFQDRCNKPLCHLSNMLWALQGLNLRPSDMSLLL